MEPDDGRAVVDRGATATLLGRLASRRREPLLHGVRATLRIDLADGPASERHFVTIDDGEVTLPAEQIPADAVIRAERSVFDAVVTGRMNATAAILRGDLTVQGDIAVVNSLFRVFPGPPESQSKLRKEPSHE